MGNIKTKDMTNVTFFAADRRQFLIPKNAVNIFAKAYNENVSGPYNPAALHEAAKRFDTCKVELTKAREQIGACINALRTQGWNPRDIRDINGLNASEQRGLRVSAAQSGATCNPDTAAQKIGEISEKYNKALEKIKLKDKFELKKNFLCDGYKYKVHHEITHELYNYLKYSC